MSGRNCSKVWKNRLHFFQCLEKVGVQAQPASNVWKTDARFFQSSDLRCSERAFRIPEKKRPRGSGKTGDQKLPTLGTLPAPDCPEHHRRAVRDGSTDWNVESLQFHIVSTIPLPCFISQDRPQKEQ